MVVADDSHLTIDWAAMRIARLLLMVSRACDPAILCMSCDDEGSTPFTPVAVR